MIDLDIIEKALSLHELSAALREEFLIGLQADENQTVAGMMHCLSVAGKPSQFVGMVTTYPLALKHREEFAAWKKANPDANLKFIKKDADFVKPLVELISGEFHDAVAQKKEKQTEVNNWKKREIEKIKVHADQINASWEEAAAAKRRVLTRLKSLL